MKNNPIHRRTKHSLRGLAEAWRRERAFRTQLRFSVAAILALAVLQPPAAWWALVLLALAGAAALELMNSAFETLTDHLHPKIHPEIGIAKDVASSAAFVLNCAAFAITAGAINATWQ